ncbi:hypothetical protein Tco_0435010 [Tanacetum coccineum]
MNSTNASSSNPSKKIKLTIIPPRQLFINISSDEDITTTPSPTTTSSSPTPPNKPSKTTSTNQTSSSQENTSSSFHSQLQISPPSLHEPTSPHNLNPLFDDILDVPPRPLNPQPHFKTQHEEEDVDDRVRTPSDYELADDEKLDDEETMDDEEDDEVINELYGDVNMNLGNEDTEMTYAGQEASEHQNNKLIEAQAENQEFINQVDSTMKAIIKDQVKAQVSKIMPKIEKYVTESLGAKVLVRSTNQPQTSYVVEASLGRDDQDKDEDPSAGSDRWTKRRKSGKDVKSSKDSRSKEKKSLSTSKDASQSQHKSSGKFAHAEEPSHMVEDSGMQQDQESNLRNKTAYTSHSDPHGIIYMDQYNRKRLMRTDELHKFSDCMLYDVWTALHHIAAGIRMEYLPMRN